MTADAGSALDVAGLTEAIRVHLRLYTLPANVARYLAPEDSHDRVAERCAPLLAEAVAAHVEALRETDRAAAWDEGASAAAEHYTPAWMPSDALMKRNPYRTEPTQ